jgi:hypothetical protein
VQVVMARLAPCKTFPIRLSVILTEFFRNFYLFFYFGRQENAPVDTIVVGITARSEGRFFSRRGGFSNADLPFRRKR